VDPIPQLLRRWDQQLFGPISDHIAGKCISFTTNFFVTIFSRYYPKFRLRIQTNISRRADFVRQNRRLDQICSIETTKVQIRSVALSGPWGAYDVLTDRDDIYTYLAPSLLVQLHNRRCVPAVAGDHCACHIRTYKATCWPKTGQSALASDRQSISVPRPCHREFRWRRSRRNLSCNIDCAATMDAFVAMGGRTAYLHAASSTLSPAGRAVSLNARPNSINASLSGRRPMTPSSGQPGSRRGGANPTLILLRSDVRVVDALCVCVSTHYVNSITERCFISMGPAT